MIGENCEVGHPTVRGRLGEHTNTHAAPERQIDRGAVVFVTGPFGACRIDGRPSKAACPSACMGMHTNPISVGQRRGWGGGGVRKAQ